MDLGKGGVILLLVQSSFPFHRVVSGPWSQPELLWGVMTGWGGTWAGRPLPQHTAQVLQRGPRDTLQRSMACEQQFSRPVSSLVT